MAPVRRQLTDVITQEVIRARLDGIVREMQAAVLRTGYSTIIRESHDFSAGITDREGNVVGQHSPAPPHLGAYPDCVQGVLSYYDIEEMAEGDCFLTNHPYYSGCPHPNDMVVVMPVIADGEVIAFCASMGHKHGAILGVNQRSPWGLCQLTCHASADAGEVTAILHSPTAILYSPSLGQSPPQSPIQRTLPPPRPSRCTLRRIVQVLPAIVHEREDTRCAERRSSRGPNGWQGRPSAAVPSVGKVRRSAKRPTDTLRRRKAGYLVVPLPLSSSAR